MGASNSRPEEDKSLQLCRARKKFIKQALNGRCSLAAAHIAYIEELKIVGAALRRFVEFDSQLEPLPHISRSSTPEPHSLKSVSGLSVSSRTLSHNVDAAANLSPPPSSTPVSSRFQSHYMKFKGSFSTKVEEKPPVPLAVSVSSTTPPTVTPRSTEAPENSPFGTDITSEDSPWDYFGLFHPIDQHFSTQEGRGFDRDSENFDELRHPKSEAGAHEIENMEDKLSSNGKEDSHISDDEFDEPSTANLVRSFKNVNRSIENLVNGDSSSMASENIVPETKFSSSENVKEAKGNTVDGISPSRSPGILETNLTNGKNNKSPDLSPLRGASSRFVHLSDVEITPMRKSEVEDQVVPKDFLTSMKTIEQLFARASESGKEVPRMLEANKFHFRPVTHGRDGKFSHPVCVCVTFSLRVL